MILTCVYKRRNRDTVVINKVWPVEISETKGDTYWLVKEQNPGFRIMFIDYYTFSCYNIKNFRVQFNISMFYDRLLWLKKLKLTPIKKGSVKQIPF